MRSSWTPLNTDAFIPHEPEIAQHPKSTWMTSVLTRGGPVPIRSSQTPLKYTLYPDRKCHELIYCFVSRKALRLLLRRIGRERTIVRLFPGATRKCRTVLFYQWKSYTGRGNQESQLSSEVLFRGFISQKVFINSLCKSQFPHKSVNLNIFITNIKNKLTNLCWNRLLQNDLMNTFCEIRLSPSTIPQCGSSYNY